MSLSVGSIGVRSGESLTASPKAKQVRGTTMIIKGEFLPIASFVTTLTNEDIRDKLNNYNFFKNLSVEERTNWLNSNISADKDPYLQDIKGMRVKFVTIGGDFVIKNLSDTTINSLLAGNPDDPDGFWLLTDVYNMFPRKPGSRAARHTLVFRPGNWDVVPDAKAADLNFTGTYFDIVENALSSGTLQKKFDIVPIPNTIKEANPNIGPIAIAFNDDSGKLSFDELLPLCENYDVDLIKEIKELISWFPPSTHKSLIQKILRTRSRYVTHLGRAYPAETVLVISFLMLLCHPGAFVPNIQRFVSGLESATKRLAVSIAEDCYIEDAVAITSLLSAAYVAQNNKTWVPTNKTIKLWIATAESAARSPHIFNYDIKTAKRIIKDQSPWYMSYYILSSIKSFRSDEDMFCSIAEHNGTPSVHFDQREDSLDLEGPQFSSFSMPIIHCIDQHCFTDIAHYFPYETVRNFGSYENVFKGIWEKATGINPRKPSNYGFNFTKSTNSVFSDIRNAQFLTWFSHSRTPINIQEYCDQVYNLKYRISDSWLSSFVGSHEINLGRSTAIVMIHPDEIYTYVAIKRPSRDTTSDPELTEQEKSDAIKRFVIMLKDGLSLNGVPNTLSEFKSATLKLFNEEYMLLLNGQAVKWEEARDLQLKFRTSDNKSYNVLYDSLTFTNEGVMVDADNIFGSYLNKIPLNVLQRAMIYLNYNEIIDLHHISRDGSGTEYMVSVDDTGVKHLLAVICVVYPAALVTQQSKFKVKSGPLMWTIINRIKKRLENTIENVWTVPRPEPRQLWAHQTESINKLVEYRNNGKKTKIIWIPPGLGKTAIVVNYISDCISNNIMPRYCVYTLPPSALETIFREFNIRNIPFVHLDMRSKSKTKDIVPGVVNIIEHDHLRMAPELKNNASEMMFIVDELHKTLNATKRTSATLEIATLARDVVAMTGTLIKDTHIEPVIKWLQQSVDFEVTTKNYWVALSSIISRTIQTKIIVERSVLEAQFTESQRKEYFSVVPQSLGGTASTIDWKKSVDVSYQAITDLLVETALKNLNSGRGVFLVARNISHQNELKNILNEKGITNIFLIDKDHSISLTPTDPPKGVPVPDVVITTTKHSEGYNLTRYNVMISGVYFTNQATRDQLEARINRIDSISESIQIILIHAGIISYVHNSYEKVRSLSAALKGFAKQVNLSTDELEQINL